MKNKNIVTLLAIWLIIAFIAYGAAFGIHTGGVNINSIGKSMKLGLDVKGGVALVYEADLVKYAKEQKKSLKGEDKASVMEQVKGVMEKRVNEMGLTEPKVTISGENRIRIELPGVKNAEEAIKTVGKVAKLEFALVTEGVVKEGQMYDVKQGPIRIDGSQVKDSRSTVDERNAPAVSLEFDAQGAKEFAKITKEASGRQIAILLDKKVISAPVASFEISNGKAQITGNFSLQDSMSLSALIRGGSLPVHLEEVQADIIGPTLGMDSLKNAVMAAQIGFLLVILFMIAYYRLPGVIASISLVLYVSVVLLVMVGLGATLTLPGVAGIVLSVGMAVDANVIIFERIREDLREGKTIRASVVAGFGKAMSTILDSNITTIIAALVLYFIGEGPIRGFATTLMIGITTSMFTAIVITKIQMKQIIMIEKLNKLSFYGGREGVHS